MSVASEVTGIAANDEDDPVEYEFNVYQARHLVNRLNILSHVTRPRDKPYRVSDASSKVKPKLHKVEFTIPTHEYRHFFKEQDSKLKLSSNKRNLEVRRLTAMTFCDGEVHLNPLSSVLELYPDMSDYFRKQQPTEKLTDPGNSSAGQPMTLITPRVMTKRTEDESKKLKESFEYLCGEEAKVPWVDVRYRTCEEEELKSMICDRSITEISEEFHMTEMDYFKRLVPTNGKLSENDANKKDSNNHVTVISTNQRKRTITNARVQLRKPAPSSNLAPISKSSVKPPAPRVTASEMSVQVSQSNVKSAAQVPLQTSPISEQHNSLITSSAELAVSTGPQKLIDRKHSETTSSLQKLPVQVTSSPIKSFRTMPSQSLSNPTNTAKHSSKSRSSVSSDMDSDDSSRSKVSLIIDEDVITSAVVVKTEEPNEEIEIIDVTNSDGFDFVTATITDSDVSKTPIDNTSMATVNDLGDDNDLVEFAKEKLKTRVVMTLDDFMKQFNMNMDGVKQGASRQQLEEALVRAGGINLSTSRHHQVYALKSRGDKFDDIRECLVELLIAKPALKMSYFKSVLDKKGLNNSSENDLRKVLKEYCITKGGSWVSKGFVETESSSSKPRKRSK